MGQVHITPTDYGHTSTSKRQHSGGLDRQRGVHAKRYGHLSTLLPELNRVFLLQSGEGESEATPQLDKLHLSMKLL